MQIIYKYILEYYFSEAMISLFTQFEKYLKVIDFSASEKWNIYLYKQLLLSCNFWTSIGRKYFFQKNLNHFNEEIVVTLVRFFLDKKVNKNGATIIFSTHYSELLDEFERNDGIYIVRNRGGIEAEKLSNILKRNDIKKSEAYDSGFLEGTVPAYEAYMALKKVLISMQEG